MENFLSDEILRLAPDTRIETADGAAAKERPSFCAAPRLLCGDVERAFGARGEFHGVLRLEWHPWEHRWAVMQRKTAERLELDARFCVSGEQVEEWIFCFWVGEDMGAHQPDRRLVNYLRSVNAAARGEREAGAEAQKNILAAQKAREAEREQEERWEAIGRLGELRHGAELNRRVSENFILE